MQHEYGVKKNVFSTLMKYRKIAAEKIFDGYRFREDHVLILAQDGRVEYLLPKEEAGEDVELFGGILSPSFVNCHCHLELSHMKGKIPEKTGLVDFVFKVVSERSANEEEILQAITAAENEMKNNGIVAVGDICNNTLTLPQKERGNLHYYNFIEASGWLPTVSDLRFERAKAIYEEYRSQKSEAGMNHCSIVPHAPYSVSENLWQAIRPYFASKVVSIHNQETKFEDEFFQHGTGDFTRMYDLMKIDHSHHIPTKRSSLQSYFNKLSGAEKIILVHNTFTKEEDINFVNDQFQASDPKPQIFFCLCVNANQYIEEALPSIEMLRNKECNIVLGTDSLASNWSLSILDEIKTIRKNFPQIPLEEILQWATLNGAKALDMESYLGSFEKGKKPGAVLLSEHDLSVQQIFF